MNLLNGSMGRVTFLTTPCCRDILKFIRHSINDTGLKTVASCCKKNHRGSTVSPCTGNLRIDSGLAMWTQVRFQQKCGQSEPPCPPKPTLHRDIDFPNFDPYRKEDFLDVRKTNWGDGDKKPGLTYVVGFFGLVAGSYALKTELVHFLSSMSAAADVLAMATIEVDISKVAEGACVSYKWRGKPLFIKHRTAADIELESQTPLETLRDPQTPEDRTQKPEWLIVIGICTHLGCVPIPNSGDYSGGFYCPCHGSHYDNVGRARKGPAPLNLEVPPYTFVSDELLLVG